MSVTFIVVSYKRNDALQACLESIYQQTGLPASYEIVVVDNGGDAQIDPPSDPRATLRIERAPGNLGVTGGRNLGMRLAIGEYWLFIDDDATWHHPDDVARLIADLEALPNCAAVAVKVLDPKDNTTIEALLPHPNKQYALNAKTPIVVPYFYGGGHILRADAVRKVGGYPERFFYGMEEIDLSLRLMDAGYSIEFDPATAIYHKRESSVVGAAYWRRNAINKSRVAWRLLPYPYPLTISIIWSVAAAVKTRQPGIIFAIWRALWAERRLLVKERHPIRTETAHHLRSIGARLLY